MIDYLIEIVFENIKTAVIPELLNKLNSNGKKVLNYTITLDSSNISWSDKKSLDLVFQKNKNFGLFVNLDSLMDPYSFLRKCGLAIYKGETTINLEINFQLGDVVRANLKNLTKQLMEFSKMISFEYEINEYYCGLEPAKEEKTRLFTREKIGPFSIEEN